MIKDVRTLRTTHRRHLIHPTLPTVALRIAGSITFYVLRRKQMCAFGTTIIRALTTLPHPIPVHGNRSFGHQPNLPEIIGVRRTKLPMRIVLLCDKKIPEPPGGTRGVGSKYNARDKRPCRRRSWTCSSLSSSKDRPSCTRAPPTAHVCSYDEPPRNTRRRGGALILPLRSYIVAYIIIVVVE